MSRNKMRQCLTFYPHHVGPCNGQQIPPLIQYAFMVLCLIKQWLHLHGAVLS